MLQRRSSLASGWRTAASMLDEDLLSDPLTQDYFAPSQRRPQAITPVICNIPLISTQALPDRFRAVFTYPLLNAVQSKCFTHVYNSNDNFVLSSPTGSGKTVVFELAICRLINTAPEGTFKIIYQAPTKSLCAERHRDWHSKFAALNLQVAELTGDVQNAQLKNVQHAEIIITTPEKWDSITRKWKDHKKLMQMVKLFLIDEVHTLKEDRGAVLEVVVSRMKSVGADVRFIALSATIPNIVDISKWLGKSQHEQDQSARQEVFGEEYRPVRIAKHVVGFAHKGNDFAFDKALSAKLPEVILKHSQGKPIMIFCFTRASCLETARSLAEWWTSTSHRPWTANSQGIRCDNTDLQTTIQAGVAFHHAGLSAKDRATVEQGYLAGHLNVICCTSTLAAGVNLPCHMVIIKNTVTYAHDASNGCKEYPDLEVVQMLGRAGRPQFGQSAVAVIMTRQHKVDYYERLVSGQETIESRLHLNLIDHLNAEIGLGTIHNEASAIVWLRSTFLYVRLQQNAQHYKLSIERASKDLSDHIRLICSNGIALLQQHDLVTTHTDLQSTAYGDAMSRYCVQFETMQTLLALAKGAKVSEILTAISQAAEFKDIYFRSGEKAVYRQWDINPLIKFPLKIYVDVRWHKVSLTIQAVLAGNELPELQREMRQDFNHSKNHILQHATRLIRCVGDCLAHKQDGHGLRNALILSRSLTAQIWDDSTLQMCQLEGLGIASVRKLVRGGITTIEELARTDSHKLEQLLSRNPPFGGQLRDKADAFPRLSVSVHVIGKPTIVPTRGVSVLLDVTMRMINGTPSVTYRHKPVQMCLLIDSGAGDLIHFSRFTASQMMAASNRTVAVSITQSTDSIRAQLSCEEYAGTAVSSSMKINLPQNSFLIANIRPTSKLVADKTHTRRTRSTSESIDYAGDLEDHDLLQAASDASLDLFNSSHNQDADDESSKANLAEPVMLESGKWACRHACKDKTRCKHLCCREGLDKKPKPVKNVTGSVFESRKGLQQSQLNLSKKETVRNDSATAQQVPTTVAHAIDTPPASFFRTLPDLLRGEKRLRSSVDEQLMTAPPQRSQGMIVDGESAVPERVVEDNVSTLTRPLEEPAISSDHQDTIMSDAYLHHHKHTAKVQDLAVDSSRLLTSAHTRQLLTPTINRLPPSAHTRQQATSQSAAPQTTDTERETTYQEALSIVRAFLGDELFTYVRSSK